MSRVLLLAGVAAVLATAGPSQAQRLDVDPKRTTSFEKPVPTRPGELIASDISDTDFRIGPQWHSEQFIFTGRAGETITVRARTDIPDFEVLFREKGYNGKVLSRGPAKDAPVTAVLPKDGSYFIIVAAKGPARVGKYLLAFGSGETMPSFGPVETVKAAPAVGSAPTTRPLTPPAPAPIAVPATPPKLTPPPGVLAAEVGKTVARPAGKVGAMVDLFAFIGEAGSVLRVTAAGAGAGGQVVTLHTPEGAEIMKAEGLDQTTLSAVLPRDGIYLLSVGRQNAAKPYKLTLAAEAPDLFQWWFRNNAGYEILKADGSLAHWTCWTAPGSMLRYNMADGVQISQTVQRGGAGRWEGKSFTNNFTTQLVDGVFTRTYDTGKPDVWSLDEPPVRLGAYRGYLCR